MITDAPTETELEQHYRELYRISEGRLDAQAQSLGAISSRVRMAEEADLVADARLADLSALVEKLRAEIGVLRRRVTTLESRPC